MKDAEERRVFLEGMVQKIGLLIGKVPHIERGPKEWQYVTFRFDEVWHCLVFRGWWKDGEILELQRHNRTWELGDAKRGIESLARKAAWEIARDESKPD